MCILREEMWCVCGNFWNTNPRKITLNRSYKSGILKTNSIGVSHILILNATILDTQHRSLLQKSPIKETTFDIGYSTHDTHMEWLRVVGSLKL